MKLDDKDKESSVSKITILRGSEREDIDCVPCNMRVKPEVVKDGGFSSSSPFDK